MIPEALFPAISVPEPFARDLYAVDLLLQQDVHLSLDDFLVGGEHLPGLLRRVRNEGKARTGVRLSVQLDDVGGLLVLDEGLSLRESLENRGLGNGNTELLAEGQRAVPVKLQLVGNPASAVDRKTGRPQVVTDGPHAGGVRYDGLRLPAEKVREGRSRRHQTFSDHQGIRSRVLLGPEDPAVVPLVNTPEGHRQEDAVLGQKRDPAHWRAFSSELVRGRVECLRASVRAETSGVLPVSSIFCTAFVDRTFI